MSRPRPTETHQKVSRPRLRPRVSLLTVPSMIVFRQRSSSIKGRIPSNVVFRQRMSSIKGHLPLKVVFLQRLSSVKGHLPSKVVFRQRSSSIKGCTCLWKWYRILWNGLKLNSKIETHIHCHTLAIYIRRAEIQAKQKFHKNKTTYKQTNHQCIIDYQGLKRALLASQESWGNSRNNSYNQNYSDYVATIYNYMFVSMVWCCSSLTLITW